MDSRIIFIKWFYFIFKDFAVGVGKVQTIDLFFFWEEGNLGRHLAGKKYYVSQVIHPLLDQPMSESRSCSGSDVSCVFLILGSSLKF